MAKYRKKPVVIEAIQFTGHNSTEVEAWMIGLENKRPGVKHGGTVLCIETLEGTMTASPGDFIIKGVQGEFYPCKPDIFEATYEKVEEI
jgi:hypothetical protein